MISPIEYAKKQQRLDLLMEKKRLKDGLPHLYGFKWYRWAWRFFKSTNKVNLLVAGNQLSKTSTQIRKIIDWSVEPDKWRVLWKKMFKYAEDYKPVFWYLYPDKETATEQFYDKWVREFLPRGEYKDHPQYGWTHEMDDKKKIYCIRFNSGAVIYFKTYSKNVGRMQSATVSAVFCDEEIPESVYSEINARLLATEGYFHMVFTATLGQEFWRRAMEEKGTSQEVLKTALKMNISAYMCMKYLDGTASPWTKKRIDENKSRCMNRNEIRKRILGRFVKDSNLKYPEFDRDRHVQVKAQIPKDWHIFAGVDVGSGGSAHPGAITWLAVNPERTKVRVVDGWRGTADERTTAGDIFDKWRERKHLFEKDGYHVLATHYDYAAADFRTIAERAGYSVTPAEKLHEPGERALNTAFKLGILNIDNLPHLIGMCTELELLDSDTPKNKAKDDYVDSLRYGFMGVPIAWNEVFKKIINKKKQSKNREPERGWDYGSYETLKPKDEIQGEIDELNELSGTDGVYG